jgi:hypothetical protein
MWRDNGEALAKTIVQTYIHLSIYHNIHNTLSFLPHPCSLTLEERDIINVLGTLIADWIMALFCPGIMLVVVPPVPDSHFRTLWITMSDTPESILMTVGVEPL